MHDYPGQLPYLIDGILTYGARIGYDGPDQFILSRNLRIENEDWAVIDEKTSADENAGLIRQTAASFPFISSPLGLVPKHGGGKRRIHHLSYPPGSSVNDFIEPSYGTISYCSFDDVVSSILVAGYGCIIMKRDIRDAFRMVPVAVPHRRLLGFTWRSTSYIELALPFGLRTAPMLFNLFAEALHWILLRHGWNNLHHYLDDFIRIFPSADAEHGAISYASNSWIETTNRLGIPRNDLKDELGTTVAVFWH